MAEIAATLKRTQAERMDQYTPWQILGIWALVALPLGLLYWVVMPILIPHLTAEPGFVYLVLITMAMVWQGVVAFLLLRREVKLFTWENIKDRLWLYTPSNPKTGVRSKWLYLWTIPCIAVSLVGYPNLGWLNDLWVKAVPFLEARPYAVIQNLAGPAVGQWWLLGVLVVMLTFNYVLGEELIFRGILLPKMNGVFGKWDWLANHLLFAAYHLHFMWNLPSRLILDMLYPWPVKQFKSYWVAVIIHGADAVGVLYLSILAIKGLT